jgi:phosphatidylinositol phosphate synthase
LGLKVLRNIAIVVLVFLASDSWGKSGNSKDNVLEKARLFIIERSRDANEVLYELNLDKNGDLDLKEPIVASWLMHTEGGRKKPLPWFQRKFGYGLRFSKINKEEAYFQFAPFSGRDFKLKKDKRGDYKVCTIVEGKNVELDYIYLQIEYGTFWAPDIQRVELHAHDPQTRKALVEVVNP